MERPWNDARTYRREFEVKNLTAQDIIEAVEKMKELHRKSLENHCDGYIFYTAWAKPHVTDEECIKYFSDNASVLVYDSKGCVWHRGKKVDKDMCMVLI